jgi:hypothetical protein
MNRNYSYRFWTWIVCFVLTLPSAVSQSQNPSTIAAQSATIVDWKGNIDILLPGKGKSHPSKGESLPSDTIIGTNNGKLLLGLSDGSQVFISPHTQVVIKTPSTFDLNYLRLLMGRIRAEISKRTGGSPSFQLGTPSAVITVRGTKFLVEVDRSNMTEVDVQEGVVEVTGLHQPSKSVVLEPGFSTRVSIEGDPENPLPTDEIRPDSKPDNENTDDTKIHQDDHFENGDDSGNAQEKPGSASGDQTGQNGPNL